MNFKFKIIYFYQYFMIIENLINTDIIILVKMVFYFLFLRNNW